jgi:hypothetical protein
MNRRLQVLIEEASFQRLAEESKRTRTPVGELVRRAIDNEFPPLSVIAERERAGEELPATPAPPGPEPDWEAQKREILDGPLRKRSTR